MSYHSIYDKLSLYVWQSIYKEYSIESRINEYTILISYKVIVIDFTLAQMEMLSIMGMILLSI